MDEPVSIPPSIPALVGEAWRNAARAAVPALPWLALLSLAGGFFNWAFETGGGTLLTLAALSSVFVAGVQASLTAYRAMIPGARGRFVALMHTNLAIYLAFFLIGFFVLFFVGLFGVMMLQLSGLVDLSAEGADAEIQSALNAMMATPYGWALAGVYATSLTGLCFLALRLLLPGAATVQTGQVMVFRTWGWTRGEVIRLGLASLATHVVPFLLGVLANMAVMQMTGTGEAGLFISGAAFMVLMAPFILAGHGLAVAALPPASNVPEVA
jgi:hypothetical protein